jgi:hypothetical protein
LVVQPAENWEAKNLPGSFDGTRELRILLQGEMRARAIVIFHVRQQQVAEVALAERDNVVKAFPSDRPDQPSAYRFCQGERSDVGRSRMPIDRSRRMKTSP